MANRAQIHTQEPGSRALGCASLLIGWDDEFNKPSLYRTDPSGYTAGFKAIAIGAKHTEAGNYLEKKMRKKGENDKWGVDECSELAITTLAHVIATDFKPSEIEVCIVGQNEEFRNLDEAEIEVILNRIAER